MTDQLFTFFLGAGGAAGGTRREADAVAPQEMTVAGARSGEHRDM